MRYSHDWMCVVVGRAPTRTPVHSTGNDFAARDRIRSSSLFFACVELNNLSIVDDRFISVHTITTNNNNFLFSA